MGLKKDNETYAQAATRLAKMESDPALLQELHGNLAAEMQADPKYIKAKEAESVKEMKCGGKMANGGYIQSYQTGGGLSYPMTTNDPMGFRMVPQDPYVAQRYSNFDTTMNPMNPYVSSNTMQPELNVGVGNINASQPNTGWQDAAAFGMQSLPSIASGLTTYLGNRALERQTKDMAKSAKGDYTTLMAPQQVAQRVSLGEERADARRNAREARAAGSRGIANAARTRGEYLAGAGSAATRVQQALGQQLGQSRQREAQMNAAERARVGSANAQAMMSTDQFNARQKAMADQRYYDLMQQAQLYKQGQYGAVTGTMQDMQKIAAQNQMISSLGDRYGYQRANWYTPNQRQIQYTGR
jgi:hypothetical protein